MLKPMQFAPSRGFVAALSVGIVLALPWRHVQAQDDPAGIIFNLRTCLSEVDSAISELQGGNLSSEGEAALSEARSHRDSFQARVLELERLASDLGSLESRIDSQRGHVDFLRIEYETALGEYDQFARWYEAEANRLEQEVEAHNQDVDNYHSELAEYEAAVDYFNSLPPEQQTEAEYNRLANWGARLDEWRANGEARGGDLQARIERFITTEGQRLVDLSLRASEKERAYVDAANELDRLIAEYNALVETFNAGLSDADALVSGIASALHRAAGSVVADDPMGSPSVPGRVTQPERPTLPDSRFLGRGDDGVADAPFGQAAAADGTFRVDFLVRNADGTIPTSGELEWHGTPQGESRRTDYGTYIQTWVFTSPLGEATATIEGSETGASGTATGWYWYTERDGEQVRVNVSFGVQFSGTRIRLLGFAQDL